MDEYKKIYEVYKLVNEASFSYGYGNEMQPKTQLAKFRKAKPANRLSTAPTTASLPTGGEKIDQPGALAPMGGIGENNEEMVDIKGFGKMPKKEVKKLYNKIKSEIHPKMEMLQVLAKHLK